MVLASILASQGRNRLAEEPDAEVGCRVIEAIPNHAAGAPPHDFLADLFAPAVTLKTPYLAFARLWRYF
jgi:hypothetical protein